MSKLDMSKLQINEHNNSFTTYRITFLKGLLKGTFVENQEHKKNKTTKLRLNIYNIISYILSYIGSKIVLNTILYSVIIFILFLLSFVQIPDVLAGTIISGFQVEVATENMVPQITANSVKLKWNKVANASRYIVNYYDDAGQNKEIIVNQFTDSYTTLLITGLNKDFIYDFRVTADLPDPTADLVSGKKILTGITFDIPSTKNDGRPGSSKAVLPDGGVQVGVRPGITFMWKIPRYYDGEKVAVYSEFDKIDYKIIWGSDVAGTNKTQINVRFSDIPDSGKYIATIYYENQVICISDNVEADTDQYGIIKFTTYGLNVLEPGNTIYAVNTENPASGIDPCFNENNMWDFPKKADGSFDFDSVNLQNIYYNPDIKPGTIYRAKIEPVFSPDFSDNGVVYLPSNLESSYAYTPIRFQISKDGRGNLLATIYKVNKSDPQADASLNFTYVVEYSTNENFYSYSASVRQSDEFSPGSTVIIFIENRNYNTKFYYRISAWSPAQNEILDSDVLDYVLSQDLSRPPLPEDVKAEKDGISGVEYTTGIVKDTFYNKDNAEYNVDTANVKIWWKKPPNYDKDILNTDEKEKIYYHFELASLQKVDTTATEKIENLFGNNSYKQEYEFKYREILKVDLKSCKDEGVYLSYTIDGTKLFSQVENVDGTDVVLPYFPVGYDDYPTYLLPNKIYYLRLYTMKDNYEVSPPRSDYSITVGFTTYVGTQKVPPAPENFKQIVELNPISDSAKPLKFSWNKISFNQTDYEPDKTKTLYVAYDLYISNGKYIYPESRNSDIEYYDLKMSENTMATFIPVGSTDKTTDVVFSGLNDKGSPAVNATVSDFSTPELIAIFGTEIRKNSLYYFAVRTRIVCVDEYELKSSFSRIISVTTVKGNNLEPEEEQMYPLAPEEFAVAVDSSGNPMYTSTGANLTWKVPQEDVKYTMIRTMMPINSDDTIEEISDNTQYLFKEYFRSIPINEKFDGLSYVKSTKRAVYEVGDLLPNTVYFFSIRTEREVNVDDEPVLLVSPWVTIPVTTPLIEMPEGLAMLSEYSIGVDFEESSVYSISDLIVSLNGNDILTASYSISEEYLGNGKSRFYVRIKGLEPNKSYSVGVRGTAKDGSGDVVSFTKTFSSSYVDERTNSVRTKTRDDMHEVDVVWLAKEGLEFEMALKDKESADYKILEAGSGFIYTSIEKPYELTDSDKCYYYARITGLNSNQGYYLKVRSKMKIKNEISGEESSTYSKYFGPILIRTEFSMEDFEGNQRGIKGENSLNETIRELKNRNYWVIDDNSNLYYIKFKEQKLNELIGSSNDNTIKLEISGTSGATLKMVYLPASSFDALLKLKKNLILKYSGMEYTLRPGSIEASRIFNAVQGIEQYKGWYVLIKFNNNESSMPAFNDDLKLVSKRVGILVEGNAVVSSEGVIEADINKNLDDILISEGKKIKETLWKNESSLANYLSIVKKQINNMISSRIKNEFLDNSELKKVIPVKEYSVPINVSLSSSIGSNDGSYIMNGYVYNGSDWEKLDLASKKTGYYAFDAYRTGIYSVFATSLKEQYGIDESNLNNSMTDFLAKYNLEPILKNKGDIRVSNLTVKDAVDILDRVLSYKNSVILGESIINKAQRIGISNVGINYNLPNKVLTREEMAGLVMKFYEIKTGISIDDIAITSNRNLNDIKNVSLKYQNAVKVFADMGLIDIGKDNMFYPQKNATAFEFIDALSELAN